MKKIILLGIALLILSGCDIRFKKSRDRLVVVAFNYGYACSEFEKEQSECLDILTKILQ